MAPTGQNAPQKETFLPTNMQVLCSFREGIAINSESVSPGTPRIHGTGIFTYVNG